MNEPAIQFCDVYKRYTLCHHLKGGIKTFLFDLRGAIRSLRASRFTALSGVTLDVPAGQTLGIVGPNGAGKSTMLGLIAGVLRADSGSVRIRGRVSPLLELGAGFHPDLSGRENVMLNGVLLGLSRSQVAGKMDAIIEFSELGEFISEPVRAYSSGMLARLGFSVAAHLDPQILLVDELLAVGDVNFQAKCIERMRQFKRDGVTIVFVSHDMGRVRDICDKVAVLEGGKLVGSGEPAIMIEGYLERMKASAPKKA